MPCTAALELEAKISAAADWIRERWNCVPKAGVILGTGLGHFADQLQTEAILPYESIPHFERATALGHRGRLLCGQLGELPVVVMDGRLHAYEGYSLAEITFPARVIHALGIELLIVTNAAGGLNPQYSPGDILVIDGHINLMRGNPGLLCGPVGFSNGDARSVDAIRLSPYDPVLVQRAMEIARRTNFAAHQGVYIGVMGPNYETRAEYRFLRRIGGDAVGMSTVPEVTVAAQLGLRILGLSTITNVGLPDAPHKTTGAEVLDAAAVSEPKMRTILLGILNHGSGFPVGVGQASSLTVRLEA